MDPISPSLAIVPAYNEAATVGGIVTTLRELPDVQVLVIDDGSQDATGDIAHSAGANVITFPSNLGIGAAVRAGLVMAHRDGYSSAFQFDADGQHDVAAVAGLLAPIIEGSADLVIGSRFLAGGYDVSMPRALAMRLVRVVVRSVTGLRLTDPSSGFRAFSRRAIVGLADRYPTDYMDSVETIALAHRVGLTITERPTRMFQRAHGTSSASPLQAVWHTTRAVFGTYATYHSRSNSTTKEPR